MDSDFLFWYPVIVEHQMDFEGHDHPKEVYLEGHIIYGGRLLCNKSREIVRNQRGAKAEKIVKSRDAKAKLCADCQEKYKKNGHSAYSAWVEGKPKTPSVALPKLAKF